MSSAKRQPEMKTRLEALVDEMLDGSILLTEAAEEFERVFIEKALERNGRHISKTANKIGIHRNTLSKRLTSYEESVS